MDALGLCLDELSLEPRHAYRAILAFRDFQLLGALACSLVDGGVVEQVAKVIAVQFQELHLHAELTEV